MKYIYSILIKICLNTSETVCFFIDLKGCASKTWNKLYNLCQEIDYCIFLPLKTNWSESKNTLCLSSNGILSARLSGADGYI